MNAVEMVKAALAEAGYPDVFVYVRKDGVPAVAAYSLPPEVFWRAKAVAVPAWPCWRCWVAADYDSVRTDCQHSTWDGAPPVVRPEASR